MRVSVGFAHLIVDSVSDASPPKVSASKINLSSLIEKEKLRKMLDKKTSKAKLSVKEIMNTPAPVLQKSQTNVSENFQKLDYLKKIPKRID